MMLFHTQKSACVLHHPKSFSLILLFLCCTLFCLPVCLFARVVRPSVELCGERGWGGVEGQRRNKERRHAIVNQSPMAGTGGLEKKQTLCFMSAPPFSPFPCPHSLPLSVCRSVFLRKPHVLNLTLGTKPIKRMHVETGKKLLRTADIQ